MTFTINLLGGQHQRKEFQCGEPSLDQYIRQYAKQDTKRRVSRVFVASPDSSPKIIAGYYTLSAGSLDTATMPDDRKRKLPKYPVPVAMLGGLAIAEHYQGEGSSWLTFIGHMKDGLWSIDLFRCESINLKSHWVMVVMDPFSRRIIGFAVYAGDCDGIAYCRMFNEIISGKKLPK